MGKQVVNTINQGGLSDRSVGGEPVKTYGQSDSSRMQSAYGSHPKSILNSGATFKFSDGSDEDVELTTDNLKAEYLNHIKRGEKTHAGSIFASADLSYSNAPNIVEKGAPAHVKPSDAETAPGSKGSTIVASGLGPNVNVSSDSIADREMVDATPEAARSPDNPTSTSTNNLLDPPILTV